MIRLSAIELERLIKPKFGPKAPTAPKGKNKVNEQVAKLQAETKLHLHGLPAMSLSIGSTQPGAGASTTAGPS